ncbi:PAC2 family-domain-containing protein [Schizophyllum amplum]|uniref:Proteasome assembly chaperone 2 n=1 Tax=Schizophyllum amplum TaxID=97359 RepID=A0A550CXE9_9AGAR|nr:PAC2 family-domain-containing protein [Auriculariopsis ampla]
MTFAHPTASIEGKILILPVVSTANVSQLAVDLLIASYGLKRLATLDPSYLVPVIGASEYDPSDLASPIEVYGTENASFAVIQQRSPVLKTHKQDFIDAILSFVNQSGVSALVTLSGVDMSNRMDEQMMIPTYHIIPTGASSLQSSPLHTLSDLPIPPYSSPVPQFLSQSSASSSEGAIPFIPGGGLTRRLLSSLPKEWSIPTVALLHFVLEGDNRSDAHLLAAVVARVIGVDSKGWRQPPSWSMGLFGTPQDQTLYG